MKALLLFFVLCSGTLHSKELSFDALEGEAYPQEVTVRGFLYRTQSGDLVLAAEPNLKNCCVGGVHKIEKQIYVDGDIEQPTSGKVYLLQGVFTVAPVKDSVGHLTRLYLLRDAYVIQNQGNASKWAVVASLVVLIATVGLAYRSAFLKK